MTAPDTSRNAVEVMAWAMEQRGAKDAAALLRAVMHERDEARAALATERSPASPASV